MFKKVLLVIINIILCFTMFTPIQANSFDDAVSDLTLTIEYKHDNKPIENVEFKLYKVADMSSNLEFTYTKQFEQFTNTIKLNNLDSNGWKETAETLSSYVQAESFIPLQTNQTNENGIIEFGKQTIGIYLILGQKHSIDGRTYSISPTLICLPNQNDNHTWMGNVVIHPKYVDIGEATTIEVIKQWDDNNSPKRPDSILVDLLMDGEAVQTIELNKNNSWRYKFENLETGHEWKAVERNIPEDYVVSISQQNTTLIIKNTLEIKEKIPELDDTGVLWWPVPVLLVGGLFFILIGLLLNRKVHHES